MAKLITALAVPLVVLLLCSSISVGIVVTVNARQRKNLVRIVAEWASVCAWLGALLLGVSVGAWASWPYQH